MSKRIVMNLLADRPIAYHPDIARVAGSVKAGILLSQLLYWSDKGKREDGYIWKTQAEWEEETALTRYEQEGARKELKKSGLLHEKLQGIPARLYYKPDTEVLYQMLDALYSQPSMGKSSILDDEFSASSDEGNSQSITESTKDDYRESTTTTGGDSDFCEVVFSYENNISMITPLVSDQISAALEEFPKQYLLDAIGIATTANNRSWRYINGILKKWRENGRDAGNGRYQQPEIEPERVGGLY